MNIFINNQHQIKAIRVNDTGDSTLQMLEVPDDFLADYCDTVKCAFCYEITKDNDGNVYQISTYPYKDLAVMESIQAQHDKDQALITTLQLALSEQYEINLALEEEVTNTQIALIEIYEGMGV